MISLRSIPLSLAIWSISRFRPSMAAPSSGARVRSEVVTRELVDRMRLGDLVERDGDLASLDRQARLAGLEAEQPAPEAAPSGLRAAGFDRDLGAQRALEIFFAGEQPVEAGRGHFEPVRDRDRIRRVELAADLARDARAVLDRHAPVALRRVDGDAQQPGRPSAREQ